MRGYIMCINEEPLATACLRVIGDRELTIPEVWDALEHEGRQTGIEALEITLGMLTEAGVLSAFLRRNAQGARKLIFKAPPGIATVLPFSPR
jgi:hypothetical protein